MKKQITPGITTKFGIIVYSATLILLLILINNSFGQSTLTYPIVDTDQEIYYNATNEISEPLPGEAFYGQDAQYTGNAPSYQDNIDGTVTDLVTGLMWQKSPDMDGDGDIDYQDKMSYDEAVAGAATFNLAGYSDWRLPSIKEMYSLIIFSGEDPSGYEGTSTEGLVPFIDTNYFDFAYGDLSANERLIDAQMASSNIYVGTTMMGNETMFGVNFADGRIKGYPTGPNPGQSVAKKYYVMYVRGNEYGINEYEDNGNSTITDNATGLMWTKNDDGAGMNWEAALNYAENSTFADYSDWRLPNAKELQSILDYTRAPSVTNSAAIDPVFNCSEITDEGGNVNYPFYWTGTTHASWQENNPGGWGDYVCFGEALGWMEVPPMSGNYTLMDVHGAGSQRSDPKSGDPANWPYGHGPQGDVIRIFNYVRLVRDIKEIKLGLKVFLEGPFNGTEMSSDLNSVLPLTQPYNSAPWNYPGNESVTSIPDSDIVDWILVELRDASDSTSATYSTIIGQQAAFLLKNGQVINYNGETELKFNTNVMHGLFVVIWHRNHLAVMSSNPSLQSEGVYSWDFTTGQNQAFGGSSAHKEISSGIWGMVSGDGDADNLIELQDKEVVWEAHVGIPGYYYADFNMDGEVCNKDKNERWMPNKDIGASIPQ